MADLFNNPKHSDVVIEVQGDSEADKQVFHLHKFPLISKSGFLAELLPEGNTGKEPVRLKIDGFPGGAPAFEQIARWLYGIDIDLTVENIAYAYCAARTLRVKGG